MRSVLGEQGLRETWAVLTASSSATKFAQLVKAIDDPAAAPAAVEAALASLAELRAPAAAAAAAP